MGNNLKTISIAFAIVVFSTLVIFQVFWRISGVPDFSSDIGQLFDSVSDTRLFAGDINLPETYDQSLIIKLANQKISIAPFNALPAQAVTEKNIIKYINAFANTDIVQIRYFNKVKEDIILKQPGHPDIFEYQIDLAPYDFSRDSPGNLYFFQEGHKDDNDYKRFIILAPFMIDANGKKSSTQDVFFELKSNGRLIIKPSATWLSAAKYPVILDPTIEINVLNVHSHPQQGENWTVDFTTLGSADLKIIPNDQVTIDDDEFVSLSCGNEKRQPQILPDDVIFYPNWSCDKTATVVHYTKKAGNHVLRFEFGGQIAYAYNSAPTFPMVFRTAATDQYTKLLLHADGTDTSTTFIDSASRPKTITANGNAQIDTAQSKFGGASALFDGTGDYLTVPDSDDWNFSTGDFTIDLYVRFASVSTEVQQTFAAQVQSYPTLGWQFAYSDSTDILRFSYNDTVVINPSWNPSINTWYHVALVRNGSTWTMYVDGASIGTASTNPTIGDYSASLWIGDGFTGVAGNAVNGHVDEVRISKSIARWTSNFTPPTAPYSSTGSAVIFRTAATDQYTKLLLHADGTDASTTFIDSASRPKTITANGNAQIDTAQSKFGGASGLLNNGTGDYLTVPDSNDWNFGSGDFTIDFWVRFNSTSDEQGILSQSVDVNDRMFLRKTTSHYLLFRVDTGGVPIIDLTSTTALSTGSWYHVAIIRNGSSWKVYLNGTSEASQTDSSSYPNLAALFNIGYDPNASSKLTGWIDEFRVSKGIARWTANFTPPTAPYSSTGSTVIFKQ